MSQLNTSFNNLDAFCTVSQLPNYDLHRAMFEGFAEKKGSGLLMWMSMSCWPSFAWRTFDYFYDTSSAYFGIKKACEPLSIIWNPTNSAAVTSTSNSGTYNPYPGGIAVVNNTGKVWTNIRAVAKIYSINGELLKEVADVNIAKLSVDEVRRISTVTNANLWPAGSTRVKFLKLEVFDESGGLLVDNFYWRDTTGDTAASSSPNYQDLQGIPKTVVVFSSEAAGSDAASNYYKVSVENISDSVAVQVRLKASDPVSGDMILPAYYGDNYFCLLPGESKVVSVDIEKLYFSGAPVFSVSGFNVEGIPEAEMPDYIISQRFTIDDASAVQVNDGVVKFHATFKGYRECAPDAAVFLAVYKDGKLVDISSVNQHMELKRGELVTLTTPGVLIDAGDPGLLSYTVKGFVWDGITYVPLAGDSSLSKWVRPPAPDIAVGKFSLASSEESQSGMYRISTFAFNGIGQATDNRWASEYSDPQWIWVDLGEERTIAKIELLWETASGRNYTIDITSDFDMGTVQKRNTSYVVETVAAAIPKNWRTITTVTGNSATGLLTYTYAPAHTARFVRMYGTSRTTTYGYSLYAFRVFERLD